MGQIDEADRDLYKALLDSAGDAMVALSARGEVLWWNAAAEALFLLDLQQARGRVLAELVPEGDRSALRRAVEQVVAGVRVRIEASWQRPSGRPLRVSMTLQPLAPDSPAGGVALHARATTDLARGERTPMLEFRLPLDSSPDALLVTGADGRILHANGQAARLFGWHLDELLGRPLEVLVPKRYREAQTGQRSQLFEGPLAKSGSSCVEMSGQRRDGSEFPIEVRLCPLRTADGVVVVSAIRDVSERHRAEAALGRANRELEESSERVSRDLGAPLGSLEECAQALLAEYRPRLDAAGVDRLLAIQGNAARAGRQVEAFLSLARVTRSDCKPERLDLTALANAILAELQREDGRFVEVLVQPGLAASLDPALGRRLLECLLGNAWKFTSATGAPRIEVGMRQFRGERIFFVRDNGAGFDEQAGGTLFVPFQRLHGHEQFPGCGIGLATAHWIVRRHGGRIWATGKVGDGATFSFTVAETSQGDPLTPTPWTAQRSSL